MNIIIDTRINKKLMTPLYKKRVARLISWTTIYTHINSLIGSVVITLLPPSLTSRIAGCRRVKNSQHHQSAEDKAKESASHLLPRKTVEKNKPQIPPKLPNKNHFPAHSHSMMNMCSWNQEPRYRNMQIYK